MGQEARRMRESRTAQILQLDNSAPQRFFGSVIHAKSGEKPLELPFSVALEKGQEKGCHEVL